MKDIKTTKLFVTDDSKLEHNEKQNWEIQKKKQALDIATKEYKTAVVKNEEEKLASNFELNILKLGMNRIQLVKGDRFTSNGSTFDYKPSTAENKGKGKRYRYQGRVDTISAKKYEKDVLRADNIKLVIDRPLSTDEPADSPYNVLNRWREWEVQYAYEIPAEELETLVIMVIQKKYNSDEWSYTVVEHEVERETNELLFLKVSHPIHYRTKIEKKEFNKVVTSRGGTIYDVVGRMDNYNENEMALFAQVETNQRSKIESAKALVKAEELNLDNVLKLKKENGF